MNKTVVPAQVRAVLPTKEGCAVFLGNKEKVFIIYVDANVGAAITMFMRETPKERPLTHDLMANIMMALGAKVAENRYQRTQKSDLLRSSHRQCGERTTAAKDH